MRDALHASEPVLSKFILIEIEVVEGPQFRLAALSKFILSEIEVVKWVYHKKFLFWSPILNSKFLLLCIHVGCDFSHH
ncbi:hypothetical protein ES703_46385 [subsurface metagenome]